MDKLKQWTPSKKLSTILNRVGLKSELSPDILKPNPRNGEFIYRKKRDSSSSSMFRGAKT